MRNLGILYERSFQMNAEGKSRGQFHGFYCNFSDVTSGNHGMLRPIVVVDQLYLDLVS